MSLGHIFQTANLDRPKFARKNVDLASLFAQFVVSARPKYLLHTKIELCLKIKRRKSICNVWKLIVSKMKTHQKWSFLKTYYSDDLLRLVVK